jgi:hypothetical protein
MWGPVLPAIGRGSDQLWQQHDFAADADCAWRTRCSIGMNAPENRS